MSCESLFCSLTELDKNNFYFNQRIFILNYFSFEMKKICQSAYTRGLILGPFFVSEKLIIMVTFVVFVLVEGGSLTAEHVYITVAIYKGIQLSTTLFIPLAVQFLAECQISVNRFQVSWRDNYYHWI